MALTASYNLGRQLQAGPFLVCLEYWRLSAATPKEELLSCVHRSTKNMDHYNRLRGAMGFPVDFELGRKLAIFNEQRRKLIFDVTKNLVVKVAAFANATDSDPIDVLNGFFYHDNEPYILTSGHVIRKKPAVVRAYFSDGNQFFTPHELTVVSIGTEQTDGTKVWWEPDLALFKCPVQPLHPPRPPAVASITPGTSAYVVAFAGWDAPQLRFNSGIVSCVAMRSFTVDTYAEPGYSGSPVLNGDGFLLGLVQGGHDPNGSKQVTAVPAHVIDSWLTMKASAPGLQAGYAFEP